MDAFVCSTLDIDGYSAQCLGINWIRMVVFHLELETYSCLSPVTRVPSGVNETRAVGANPRVYFPFPFTYFVLRGVPMLCAH